MGFTIKLTKINIFSTSNKGQSDALLERTERRFNKLNIPKTLEAALPFASKVNIEFSTLSTLD